MSGEEYIRKEKELMEKAYKEGISPQKWISTNATAYARKYANNIAIIPGCGCIHKLRHRKSAAFFSSED